MLNKVKVGFIVATVLSLIKAFAPDVGIPDGLEQAIIVIITFVTQFFVKETPATVSKLSLK